MFSPSDNCLWLATTTNTTVSRTSTRTSTGNTIEEQDNSANPLAACHRTFGLAPAPSTALAAIVASQQSSATDAESADTRQKDKAVERAKEEASESQSVDALTSPALLLATLDGKHRRWAQQQHRRAQMESAAAAAEALSLSKKKTKAKKGIEGESRSDDNEFDEGSESSEDDTYDCYDGAEGRRKAEPLLVASPSVVEAVVAAVAEVAITLVPLRRCVVVRRERRRRFRRSRSCFVLFVLLLVILLVVIAAAVAAEATADPSRCCGVSALPSFTLLISVHLLSCLGCRLTIVDDVLFIHSIRNSFSITVIVGIDGAGSGDVYFPWFIQPNRTVILQLLALLDQFTSATIEDILSSAADNDDDGDDGGPVEEEEEEGGKEKKEEEEVAYFGRMACLCLQLVCAHVSSLAANGVTAVDAGWLWLPLPPLSPTRTAMTRASVAVVATETSPRRFATGSLPSSTAACRPSHRRPSR